jgi:hypothetical protein
MKSETIGATIAHLHRQVKNIAYCSSMQTLATLNKMPQVIPLSRPLFRIDAPQRQERHNANPTGYEYPDEAV